MLFRLELAISAAVCTVLEKLAQKRYKTFVSENKGTKKSRINETLISFANFKFYIRFFEIRSSKKNA